MQQVAVHTLKNSLSAVLEKVQAGEEAIITSHRKPIAKIVALTAEAAVGLVRATPGWTPVNVADKPAVQGVTWRSGRFIPKDVTPVVVRGEGPTVADILVAQRRGDSA